MRSLARTLVVALALGVMGCGRKPLGRDDGDAGVGRGGGTASGGSFGGTAAGTTGSATAGTTGGTIAGTGAGGAAGSSGGAIAGASGGAIAGSGGGGNAGTAGDLGPVRLVIFYTRSGTTYPEWWPTGSERDFSLNAVLQPLEPYKSELIVVSGLSNATIYMEDGGSVVRAASYVDPLHDAMLTLLTARPVRAAGVAEGLSFDTAVGDCGGTAGPPLRLTVGKFAYDDGLAGVSFGADGVAIRGERDPNVAAMRVLGHGVTAPDPNGILENIYPALGAAHIDVAVEALATAKACAVTLMWGDYLQPRWLNAFDYLHELSHYNNSIYSAVTTLMPPATRSDFMKVQIWYAQQLAVLLGRLRSIPLGNGTLLDRSVVVWISETGSGGDHIGYFIPVVIAGRGGGRLDVARFIEVTQRPVPWAEINTVKRTQGDLLAALAQIWGIPSFGDPAIVRQPLTEIFLP